MTGGLLVIGDVMLDVVAVPDPPVSVDFAVSNYVNGKVEFRPGGTGIAMATAALASGWSPVHLIHSVGRTEGRWKWLAEDLMAEIDRLGVRPITNVDPNADTGVAVIGYFGDGRRMMYGSPGANAASFSPAVVEAAQSTLNHMSALLVSGYMVFRPSSVDGVMRVMASAKEAGVPVALDVVPHSIARGISLERFEQILRYVDFLSVELNTLLAFYRAGRWPNCGEAVAHQTVERIVRHVTGVLVYPEFRRYWLADRSGVMADEWLDGPADAANRRGRADLLLTAVLREHFIHWHRTGHSEGDGRA